MFNLWTWELGKWVVHSTYKTSKEAHVAGRRVDYKPQYWTVARIGNQKDEHMKEHCHEQDAPDS